MVFTGSGVCWIDYLGGDFIMAGSLTIAYRRKRNVGGRVLRNFARSSTDTLADTFREKMLHAFDCKVRCKVYICSRRFIT